MTATRQTGPGWEIDPHADGAPAQPKVEPLRVGEYQRPSAEEAVAVFGTTRPAADDLVLGLARRPDDPILLQDVHDLLETEEIWLQGRHVGEDQRQPFRPAVGEVEDVQGGDVESVHRVSDHSPRSTGSANENVDPRPSSDSTQIRPPCCSTTWREIASPRPVPPPASARSRARSTL